jgi:hypothetical protein
MRKPFTKAGPGRPKGSQNKVPAALKDMILGALSDAGGQGYLANQAKKNPTAFLALVGKVLPLQVTGEGGGPVVIVTGVQRAEEVSTGGDRTQVRLLPAQCNGERPSGAKSE